MRRLDPAWRKAPVVLLRFPAVLAAMIGTAAVLGLAAASAPFFLASGASAALDGELARVEPRFAGLRASITANPDAAAFAAADAALRAELGADPLVGEPTVELLGGLLLVGEGPTELRVRPLARTGALAAVEPLAGGDGAGVWLPERLARSLGVTAGDTLELRGARSATVRVAAVHADLKPFALPPYWQELANLLVPRETGAAIEPPPPPLLLFDLPDLVALREQLGSQGSATWTFPLERTDLSAAEARAFVRRVDRLGPRLRDEADPVGAAVVAASQFRGHIRLDTAMAEVVHRTAATTTGLVGPVRTLGLAGQAVALLVVGAAAAFRARRRQVELRLLVTRGVGPGGQALRAVAEAAPAVAVGAAGGWLLARWGVAALGPGARGVGAADADAAGAVAAAAAVGLAAVGLVTAAAVHRLARDGAGAAARVSGRLPWEPAVLALAAAAWYQLSRGGSAVVTEQGDTRVDLLLLAFPLLLLGGLVGVAVRVLRRVLPELRGVGADWSIAPYLAVRRLTGASTTAVVLVAAGALSLGVLVYAGAVAGSAQRTTDAKAQVTTGSDVAAALPRGVLSLEPPLSGATIVARGTATLLPADVVVDVLTVDPATFAEGVDLGTTGAPAALPALLEDLRGGPVERLPLLVAGDAPVAEAQTLRSPRYAMEVHEVARADVVPGLSGGRPAVLVDRTRFAEVFSAVGGTGDPQRVLDPELWARGSPERVLGYLEGQGIVPAAVRSATDVRELPEVRAVGWALGYLRALGVVAALLAAACTLLYLQERQRARDVAYALTSRMGLTPGMHRRAVALEIAGLLLSALALGGLLALLAARLIVAEVDPLPAIPLQPTFAVPGTLLASTLLAVGLLCVAGAVLVQRAAERARLGEVLRAAE
jgi:putative ABC transport system permease protein